MYYFLLFYIITSFFISRIYDYLQPYLIISCYILILLVGGLRYGIGADYFSYKRIFDSLGNKDFFSLGVEPGIELLMRLSGVISFNYGFEIFIFISFFLTLAFYFISLREKFSFLPVFAFIFILLLPSFTLIAQFVSISVLLMLFRTVDRGFVASVFVVILASFFHYSAIICIPILLFLYFKAFFKFEVVFVLMISLLSLSTTLAFDVINSSLIQMTKYGAYVKMYFSEPAKIGTGLGVILKILPVLIFLFSVNRNMINIKSYRLAIILSYVYIISVSFSVNVFIFSRLAEIGKMALVFIFVNLSLFKFYKFSHRVTSLVILFCFLISFLLMIVKARVDLDRGLRVSPYSSVLFEEGNE